MKNWEEMEGKKFNKAEEEAEVGTKQEEFQKFIIVI